MKVPGVFKVPDRCVFVLCLFHTFDMEGSVLERFANLQVLEFTAAVGVFTWVNFNYLEIFLGAKQPTRCSQTIQGRLFGSDSAIVERDLRLLGRIVPGLAGEGPADGCFCTPGF